MSAAFRESQTAAASVKKEVASKLVPKPPVQLQRDSLYVTREPKVPTKVIWGAAAMVFLGVVLWSVYSSIQCSRKVEYLERLVQMLAERQGIYVRHGL